jgi:energy-coupling factor transport system permease protein
MPGADSGEKAMIKNVTLGQYFPGDSVIHRMDPRVKLLLVIAIIVLIFLVDTLIGNLVVFAFLLFIIIVSRVSFKLVLRSLKPLWFIILLAIVLNTFFYSGGTELFSWWIFRVSREGLINAARLAARLIFLITATTMLTLTTSPISLTDALERLMRPLKVVRFPVHELAMMMTIAMRFIPTLLEETDKIMKAQTARGAEFDSGSILKRAAGMVPILVPLFVSAFRRADELAFAMESRCYHGGEGRTRMKVMHMHARDAIASAVVAGLLVFAALGY